MDVVPSKMEAEAAGAAGAAGSARWRSGSIARADSRAEGSRETMSSLPSVAVVILNWNGRYFLEKFLPSVYNSTYPNVQFVIGDNGSEDDSVAFVRENYPSVTVVQNDRNYGFAGG